METEIILEAPLKFEASKKYRITAPNGFGMEFFVCSIDESKDAIYIKIVAPFSSHQGCKLSSLIKNEGENKVELLEEINNNL